MNTDPICLDLATPTADMQRDSQLLSSDEAADFLRISRKTLPTWRALGKSPPFRKLGTRVVYTRSDLEAFVKALPRR